MADDDVIITESETPADAAPDAPAEAETDDAVQSDEEDTSADGEEDVGEEGDESEEGDEDAEDAEDIEFDFGGTKERFKKTATVAEVAERLQGFSKQIYGDYIQKTQKLASQAKTLETRAEELKVLGEASQEYYAQYGAALQHGQYLDQLRALDLPQLWQKDPDQARKVSDEIRRTEGVLAQMAQEMERVERDTKSKHAEIYTKRAEEGKKAIAAKVPDFETKHAADVVKYVTSTYNVSEEDAQRWALSPDVTVMAYKAMLYDRAKAQAKAPPKVKQAEVPVQPIKGRGTARKPDPTSPDSDKLSDAEWFALRNKQVIRR